MLELADCNTESSVLRSGMSWERVELHSHYPFSFRVSRWLMGRRAVTIAPLSFQKAAIFCIFMLNDGNKCIEIVNRRGTHFETALLCVHRR